MRALDREYNRGGKKYTVFGMYSASKKIQLSSAVFGINKFRSTYRFVLVYITVPVLNHQRTFGLRHDAADCEPQPRPRVTAVRGTCHGDSTGDLDSIAGLLM